MGTWSGGSDCGVAVGIEGTVGTDGAGAVDEVLPPCVFLPKVDVSEMACHASASLEQHALESLAVNVAVSLILPSTAREVEEESVLQV